MTKLFTLSLLLFSSSCMFSAMYQGQYSIRAENLYDLDPKDPEFQKKFEYNKKELKRAQAGFRFWSKQLNRPVPPAIDNFDYDQFD